MCNVVDGIPNSLAVWYTLHPFRKNNSRAFTRKPAGYDDHGFRFFTGTYFRTITHTPNTCATIARDQRPSENQGRASPPAPTPFTAARAAPGP